MFSLNIISFSSLFLCEMYLDVTLAVLEQYWERSALFISDCDSSVCEDTQMRPGVLTAFCSASSFQRSTEKSEKEVE